MASLIIDSCAIVAIAALGICIESALPVLLWGASFDSYLVLFNVLTLVWFITAPIWLVPELFGEKIKKEAERAIFRIKRSF
jgi:hypothetical protein